jgi:hypothetical protein
MQRNDFKCNDTQHKSMNFDNEWKICMGVFSDIRLRVVLLSVVWLNAIMLSAVRLSTFCLV